jgi:Protein of unknown function (DUF2844)
MKIKVTNSNLMAASGLKGKSLLLAVHATESGVILMKISTKNGTKPTSSFSTLWAWAIGAVLVGAMLPRPAFAALGGDVSSVHEDQAKMKSSLKTTQAEAYTVHELKDSAGTVVKEYVSPAGKVFAISWHGPFIPNMQQFLGTYFQQFADAAKAQRERGPGHRPVGINQPGLVFQNGGHMRSYFGKVYVPEMVPQGVNPNAIQ